MNSMNLIDRDKLIERLEISGCETCRFGGEYCVDCKLIDAHRVLSAIESMPKVNEWIPVERELPKDNKKVVIVDADGDVYIARHINGNWDCLYFSYDYEDVVAWKPIEPYEVTND